MLPLAVGVLIFKYAVEADRTLGAFPDDTDADATTTNDVKLSARAAMRLSIRWNGHVPDAAQTAR